MYIYMNFQSLSVHNINWSIGYAIGEVGGVV